MAEAIVRLGELRVESFVQGEVNNWLVYDVLPKSKLHSSGLDGDVILKASTPAIEIVESDLDIPIEEGYGYAFSVGTDNKLKVAFNKSLHTDKTSAISALSCASVTYEQGNLTPNGNNYIAIARNSMGEEIHRTTPMPLTALMNVITTLDDTRATAFGGNLIFHIERDYIVN
ncbi:hypothetical protein [Paenibacillus naphthalenovorans]|uniref:Uncharacterized protein n=1 Tax=Paenibacillus naphthalenovorans TaxID=162209 RepID=A0A0U2VFN5_9BACL|nr:hypothetical protein [Paenibacillus naphthalenovorans]ALS22307.1 hypothetical protein IJ22_19330 [Paenibacillus naphthalenovorans]